MEKTNKQMIESVFKVKNINLIIDIGTSGMATISKLSKSVDFTNAHTCEVLKILFDKKLIFYERVGREKRILLIHEGKILRELIINVKNLIDT